VLDCAPYKVSPVHAMKGYRRMEVQLHSFLTLVPDGITESFQYIKIVTLKVKYHYYVFHTQGVTDSSIGLVGKYFD